MDIIKPFIERDDPQVYFSAFADKQDYLFFHIETTRVPMKPGTERGTESEYVLIKAHKAVSMRAPYYTCYSIAQ